MKKIISVLLLISLLISMLALTSCGDIASSLAKGIGGKIGEWLMGKFHVHTIAITTGTNSTCTEHGFTESRYCLTCGKTIIPQQELPLGPHTLVDIPDVESTCTERGTHGGKICSHCKETIVSAQLSPLKPHTPETIPSVDPTCESTGLSEGQKCSVCNTILVQQRELPKAPHTYDDKYDATCNECGFTRPNVECSHSNVEILEGYEATCTSTGLTQGLRCKECEEIINKQEIIPKKNHTEVIDSAVDATCQSTGLTEGKHCSVCNTIIVGQWITSALSHVESDWIVDKKPTVDSEGLKHKECTECHTVLKQEIIPMLSWVAKETKTNYYAEFPEGYSVDSHLSPKYSNEKIENSISGNIKIVVTETKIYSYLYWHWVSAEKAPNNRLIGSYYGQPLGGDESRKAIYFHEFESFENYGHTDTTGVTEGSHVFFCDRANAVDGSWWWYQIPVYVQTYTVYELSE